jgi:hypothetical protein
MRIIPTKKFFGGTLFRVFRNQKGQGFLEYLLILVVVLGVLFVAARPWVLKLENKFKTGFKAGIFTNDPTGSNFYYYPIK